MAWPNAIRSITFTDLELQPFLFPKSYNKLFVNVNLIFSTLKLLAISLFCSAVLT